MTPIPLEDLAQRLRDGRTCAAELMAWAASRHDGTEHRLNAYRTWAGDRAAAQAKAMDTLLAAGVDLGPMMGIPMSIKDLFGVPGLPVYAGTDTAFPEDWQRAGPVVQQLLAGGAVVTGKTHTVEFAFGGLGTNPHWGTPVNPWSAAGAPRAPGGSSSGAGVSLAQGSALAALGTDTAGSVRIPAAFTGQTALKVTHGKWSLDGIVPLSPSFDTPGILARTIGDLAFLFAALDGCKRVTALEAGALRIGVIDNVVWDDVDSSIAANTEAALTRLEATGARVTRVRLDGAETVLEVFRNGGLAAPELLAFLEGHAPDRIGRLDPAVLTRVTAAHQVTASVYLQRRALFFQKSRAVLSIFDNVDVLMTPTVAISAPLLDDIKDPATYGRANMLALRNTAIVNLLGLCAVTLPTGLDSSGIPTGLQIIAPPLAERRLLAAALGVETVIGTGPDLIGLPSH